MTAAERARVRELVERTCREQGVPVTVPPDVARDIAAMVAAGSRRRRRSPAHATAAVPMAVVAAAREGGGRAP